jgi:hypothetical protein
MEREPMQDLQAEEQAPTQSEKTAASNAEFVVQARDNTLVKFVLYETKPVPPPHLFITLLPLILY